MKSVSILLAFFSASVSFAGNAVNFSAFANGDDLHITVLADSCNEHYGTLKVAPFCREGRFTQNYAPSCSARVSLTQTKMSCEDMRFVPRVVTVSLRESKIASEATLLKLKYQNQEIEVQISR